MNSSEAMFGLGMLASALMAAMMFGFIMWLLLVIAHWRMFTKAGEAGWKALIPIYSDYVLFKLVWDTRNFWIWFGLGVVSAVITTFGGGYAVTASGELVATGQSNFILSVMQFVVSLGVLIWTAFVSMRTALAYGKRPSFGVGLFLLPFIFNLILGFGSAEYIGPQD